jgi:hypothetical protein
MFNWLNRLLGSHDSSPSIEPTTTVHISPTLAFQFEPQKTMAQLTEAGRTQLRTCMSCHKRTPFPIDTPPFGLALVCQHCRAPLISVDTESNTVSPERLQKSFGYRNRCLVHAACPWCRKNNYAITAPANCRIGGLADRKPQNPNAVFRMQIDCVHCGTDFWMEWD